MISDDILTFVGSIRDPSGSQFKLCLIFLIFVEPCDVTLAGGGGGGFMSSHRFDVQGILKTVSIVHQATFGQHGPEIRLGIWVVLLARQYEKTKL